MYIKPQINQYMRKYLSFLIIAVLFNCSSSDDGNAPIQNPEEIDLSTYFNIDFDALPNYQNQTIFLCSDKKSPVSEEVVSLSKEKLNFPFQSDQTVLRKLFN